MPDRTINFGESETEATYQIQDTDGAAGGGNFVVAKDTNANTVLLEYQPGSDTWEYAGDVDMNGGNVSGVGTLTADSVNTVRGHITRQSPILIGADGFRSDFDGADIDARLDAALSAASSDDILILESGGYTTDRTISTELRLIGSGVIGSNIVLIDANWTFDAQIVIDGVVLSGDNEITINGSNSAYVNTDNPTSSSITVQSGGFRYIGNRGGEVTFESGASGGIVDGCSNTGFTDNDGGNTQGDIA